MTGVFITNLGIPIPIGVIGGVSEIPAEAAKQYTQETRTGTDAMLAIGGATVLSGILGSTSFCAGSTYCAKLFIGALHKN